VFDFLLSKPFGEALGLPSLDFPSQDVLVPTPCQMKGIMSKKDVGDKNKAILPAKTPLSQIVSLTE